MAKGELGLCGNPRAPRAGERRVRWLRFEPDEVIDETNDELSSTGGSGQGRRETAKARPRAATRSRRDDRHRAGAAPVERARADAGSASVAAPTRARIRCLGCRAPYRLARPASADEPRRRSDARPVASRLRGAVGCRRADRDRPPRLGRRSSAARSRSPSPSRSLLRGPRPHGPPALRRVRGATSGSGTSRSRFFGFFQADHLGALHRHPRGAPAAVRAAPLRGDDPARGRTGRAAAARGSRGVLAVPMVAARRSSPQQESRLVRGRGLPLRLRAAHRGALRRSGSAAQRSPSRATQRRVRFLVVIGALAGLASVADFAWFLGARPAADRRGALDRVPLRARAGAPARAAARPLRDARAAPRRDGGRVPRSRASSTCSSRSSAASTRCT